MKKQCDKCDGKGFIEVAGLALRRKELKLTQKDVSDYLGIQRSTYAMVEGNHSTLTAEKIRPLATILQIEVAQLLELMYGDDV